MSGAVIGHRNLIEKQACSFYSTSFAVIFSKSPTRS